MNMPLAHGTNRVFRKFDLEKLGGHTNAPTAKLGIWTKVRQQIRRHQVSSMKELAYGLGSWSHPGSASATNGSP